MSNKEKAEFLPNINTGVIFLFIKDGKILIEDRPEEDRDFGSLSIIPGGKIRYREGELPEKALIREIEEELGDEVKVKTAIDLGEFSIISRRGKIQRPRAYLIRDFEGNPQNTIPDKGKHRWVLIDDYDKELPLAASKLVVERALKVLNEGGS